MSTQADIHGARKTDESKIKKYAGRTILLPLFFCLQIFLSHYLSVGRAAETAKPLLSIPPGPEILARLNKAHPRLLASAADFAALKQRIANDSQLQDWQRKLEKEAQALLTAPVSKYEIPDGLRLLATSRRVMNRVYTLALVYRLTGDRRLAERAGQELTAAADFPDWNPRHFLDTAEMTHAFAIAYDWLYEVWTPEQRQRLRQAIVEKGLQPALKLYRARSGWTRARHNWNQVCNGGIGMGALALGEVEPELAGEILHGALESLPLAMAEFAPDGAWKEGPGYWNYATIYNVVFLAALDSALGTDYGLSRLPGFSQTGLFPLYLTGPIERTFNYADGGDRAIHAAQLFWLARKFDQPVCAWYERQTKAPSALDLLWFDPRGASPKAAGLPLDKHFTGTGIVTLRSEWDDPNAVFVGFKGGDNKANHSHLDLGSFVLDAGGVRWAVDLGADNYNFPGYFGRQRWTYYRLRAEGQNTLVLNPGAAPDQDPAAAAPIVRFDCAPAKAFAVADLTRAYAKAARKVWRGMALLERRRVLIQDEIDAAGPAEAWWFMHTRADVSIGDDGRTATLLQAGKRLRAEILSPEKARFEVREAQPLPSSPRPERQGKNDEVRKLTVHLSGVEQARLAVLLTPVSDDAGPAEPALRLSALSDW